MLPQKHDAYSGAPTKNRQTAQHRPESYLEDFETVWRSRADHTMLQMRSVH